MMNKTLHAQLSTTIEFLANRSFLRYDEGFRPGTRDVLILSSSEDMISFIASNSDLVASKSEESLFSQPLSGDRNSSGNCVSAFEVELKIPASRSSLETLQIVSRPYSSASVANECWFFSSKFRTFLTFRTRAFGPVKTFRQCRYTDFLCVWACVLVIVC